MHTDKQRLKVAETMAKDFLKIHRACTYKELDDVERDNMEKLAVLARQVSCDTKDYNPNNDDKFF